MNKILLILLLFGWIVPLHAQSDTVFVKKFDGTEYEVDTLNLTYITYNQACACTCAHCIRYQFLDKHQQKVNYVMIRQEEKTVTEMWR